MAKRVTKTTKSKLPARLPGYDALFTDVAQAIELARLAAARSVNAVMTATYWLVGRRIVEEEQEGRTRAGYGDALLKRLSADLTVRFGRGFSHRNLEQMRALHLGWPISQTLSAKSAPALGSLQQADISQHCLRNPSRRSQHASRFPGRTTFASSP